MAQHRWLFTVAHTLRRAARWGAAALVDGSMAVMFIVITIPAIIAGIASAIGTAAGLWLFAFGNPHGTTLGSVSFAMLATCIGLLAAQDRLFRQPSQENGEVPWTLAEI